MVTISLKLSQKDDDRLKSLAAKRRTTKSAIIRQAVRKLLKNPNPAPKGSFLDGIEDLVGKFPGPRDLSTNPKYLREALRDRHHRRRSPDRPAQSS